MKKFLVVLLTLAFMSAVLTGCTSEAEMVSDGVYKMYSEDEKAILSASISLNTQKSSFIFSFDPLSSYLYIGSYIIKDKILTASDSGSANKYLFKIIDKETLAFVADGSANVSLIDDRLGVKLYDGAIFKLSE